MKKKNARNCILSRLSAVLLLAAAVGCSNGSSSKSVSTTSVSQTGAIVADPARNRIYVTDAGNQRLLAFNSVTGALEASTSLASSPEGVTSDARGARVFVTLPSLHQVVVLDGATFAQTALYTSSNALHAIAWRDTGRVIVASDVGLLMIDVDAAIERAIVPGTSGNGLIVQDQNHRRVWTAFSLNDQLGVATIDPDLAGDQPVGNFLGLSIDPPVSLTLSFDDTSLFVGLSNASAIDIIDATAITLTTAVNLPPALVAVAPNTEATRLYVSPGDTSATDYPADTFMPGTEYLANHAILRAGSAVDTLSSNLLVHLSDSTVETLPLFEDTLFGEPNLVTGSNYTLTLTGTPGEHYFLVGAARPGFIHYGSATAQPQKFVDLDLATALVLAQGDLDATGKTTFTGTLTPATITEGTQFFLQAVVVDPATHSLGAPTNPMRVTIFDPLNPP